MIFNPALIRPKISPPLGKDFIPAALYNKQFEQSLGEQSQSIVIGLERNNGEFSRFPLKIFCENTESAKFNYRYVERMVKFLLWQRGGWKLYIGGSNTIGEQLIRDYSNEGYRKFDAQFMGNQVYEKPFTVISCDIDDIPPSNETGKMLGRHLDGFRIGFDLGASDRKVSAVINGNVVYSEEVNWEPKKQNNPEYHYDQILTAIKSAASKMPRVDAIGGSSAGIYVNNRPMAATIFRGVPAERFIEISNLFLRIKKELGVPLEVINDGDVTALAGSMSLGDNSVLGIALGSSLAAGYVDTEGSIKGWLNELAFAPIDYSSQGPVDEWSGDIGCGASYLSQQCVFRIAEKVGIPLPPHILDAEKLVIVQEKLEKGHEGAIQIWQTMGVYLGYALAHYAQFYEIKHVLILGRCTSGLGGNILLEKVNQILELEFMELKPKIDVQLPDEKSRRIGQSVAAASLPIIVERD